MKSLTLFDFSDRELLHIIEEEQLTEGEHKGWTLSSDIADRVGLTNEQPTSAVGSRMAWLKRYGAVENIGTMSGYWKLTRIGRSLMDGELDERDLEVLEGMDSAQLIAVTTYLGKRWRRSGQTASHLIRREWNRGTHVNGKRPG